MKEGDFVIDIEYGYQGIIDKVYKNFYDYSANSNFITTGDGLTWLKAQKPEVTPEQVLEKWYSIKCIDGGSICVCESRLKHEE